MEKFVSTHIIIDNFLITKRIIISSKSFFSTEHVKQSQMILYKEYVIPNKNAMIWEELKTVIVLQGSVPVVSSRK